MVFTHCGGAIYWCVLVGTVQRPQGRPWSTCDFVLQLRNGSRLTRSQWNGVASLSRISQLEPGSSSELLGSTLRGAVNQPPSFSQSLSGRLLVSDTQFLTQPSRGSTQCPSVRVPQMMSSPSSVSQPNTNPLCSYSQSNLRSVSPAICVRLISEKLGRPSTSSSPSRYLSWG